MSKETLICPLCGEDTTFKFHSHEPLVTCDECGEEICLDDHLANLEASLAKWKQLAVKHAEIVKICNGE
jgi:uncharacterized Zn finger protein